MSERRKETRRIRESAGGQRKGLGRRVVSIGPPVCPELVPESASWPRPDNKQIIEDISAALDAMAEEPIGPGPEPRTLARACLWCEFCDTMISNEDESLMDHWDSHRKRPA